MSSKNRHPLGTKKNKNQSVLEVTNQLRKSGSVEKREVENQAFGPFGSICSFKGTKWLLKNRRSYHLYIYTWFDKDMLQVAVTLCFTASYSLEVTVETAPLPWSGWSFVVPAEQRQRQSVDLRGLPAKHPKVWRALLSCNSALGKNQQL